MYYGTFAFFVDFIFVLWYTTFILFRGVAQLVARMVRDLIATLAIELFQNPKMPCTGWLFRTLHLSYFSQNFTLTTDLTTCKKLNILPKSRCSAAGSAHGSGPWGPEFEPPHFDHKNSRKQAILTCFWLFFYIFLTNLVFSVDHRLGLFFGF